MGKKILKPVFFWGTLALFAVLLVSHNYNDLLVTTRHGINLWDILLNGEFFAFYDINRCPSGNAVYNAVQGCAYNILVYITFAIWNFPLYLLERFAGVDVMNVLPCLVYIKLLPVAGMVITAIIMKKILEALSVPKEQHQLMLYLYITSTLIVSVIFITGQYDILSLAFQLLGVYAFIKRNDKQFILWFGIAFCFKYFAAVIFLPLLLLRQKKVFAWIRDLVLLIIPWLFTKIPFLVYGIFKSSAYSGGVSGDKMAVSFMAGMLGSANANVGVNLFVIAYACILVWCYLQKSEAEANGHNGIWACLLAYTAFFGLMDSYPYWSVLLAPFVTLAIAMAPQQLYLNLILETIGMAGLVFTNMVRWYWVYFGDTLKPMIWPHILKGTHFDVGYGDSLINRIVLFLNQETYHQEVAFPAIVNSMFLAAMIALAVLSYPGKGATRLHSWPEEQEYQDVLLVRFAVNICVCLLPIIAVFL